ncbi:MAG: DNA/RNA nuclease SfsA [Deltaproteobacteria bacterium]|nr:DNA/RNA nuclease SfsA [Deltaproteobacteria bacterium]
MVRFRRREQRFKVLVEDAGQHFWVHCNNSGSMLGLLRPGAKAVISPARNPGRKLSHTLELIEVDGFWAGVNTSTPNKLLRLSWEHSCLPETQGYEEFRSEAMAGHSRLDAFLSGSAGQLWVEAKNVTLVEGGVAYFPDALTLRGRKHLSDLISLAHQGHRVACFLLIQREDARCFAPADFIDPAFADLFWKAMDQGVEMWPYQGVVTPEGVGIGPRLPVFR